MRGSGERRDGLPGHMRRAAHCLPQACFSCVAFTHFKQTDAEAVTKTIDSGTRPIRESFCSIVAQSFARLEGQQFLFAMSTIRALLRV